jgi:hypothetical protein
VANQCYWFTGLIETDACTSNIENCHWGQRLTGRQKRYVQLLRKYDNTPINLKKLQEDTTENLFICDVFEDFIEVNNCSGITDCFWFNNLPERRKEEARREADEISYLDFDKYFFDPPHSPEQETE